MGLESGTPFNEVDLEEGEWVDYDEKVFARSTMFQEFAHRCFRQRYLWASLTWSLNGEEHSGTRLEGDTTKPTCKCMHQRDMKSS